MPTPREAYSNTVEQQGFTGARVRPADFSAGQIVARSVTQLGQAVTEAGNNADDIHTIYATAAAKQADTQAMLKLSSIATSFETMERGDAIAAKDKAIGDIAGIEVEQMAALKDDRARQMFKTVFEQRKAAALQRIDSHEIKETLAYHDEQSEAREQASLTLAADSYGDPATMNTNIATAISERLSRARGASDEVKQVLAAQVRSKGLMGAWAQIQANDALGAEAFRAEHSADILPEDEVKMIHANAAGLFDERVDLIEEDFFKNGVDAAPAPTTEEQPTRLAAVSINPIRGKDYSPVAGARRGDDAAAHARRGSFNKGIDFAAPAGSAIRPPMEGTVVERGFSKDNGNYVKVQYDNGYTGIFLHLKGPAPVGRGDKVDPGTIIGAVGSTGHSTGPHVHYSVRAPGPHGDYVDPDTVTYQADRNGVIRNRPQDVDVASVYDRAYAYAEAHNLGKKETDALLRRIDVRTNRDRQLKDQREEMLSDEAMKKASQLGEGLIKESQIPGFADLPWRAQEAIRRQIEVNTKPKEPEAGGQSYVDAMVTLENDPEAFRTLNLDAMPLTRGERTRLKIKQGTLTNNDGTPNKSAIDDQDYINQRMNTYLRSEGIVDGKVDKAPEVQAREALRERVLQLIAQRERENGGKKLKPLEVDAIVQEQVTRVTYNSPGGRVTKRLYEVRKAEPGATLSINRRDRARNALRRANGGIPPTDAQIDAFLREHAD